MTKTALNTAQPEYWQLAGNWSPAGIPAATDTVVVPAGIAIQTQASDALAGTLGYDTGGNARTASTTISGSVTLNELSGETDFDAAVTINSGGALLANDPTTYISDHSGGSIVVNGMLNLSGTIGANLGWPGGTMGYVDCPGGLTIHAGADPQLQSDDVPLQRRLGHESLRLALHVEHTAVRRHQPQPGGGHFH